MSDELTFLQGKIERLHPDPPVRETRRDLLDCLLVANTPRAAITLARTLAESLTKKVLGNLGIPLQPMFDGCLKELEKPVHRALVPLVITSALDMVKVWGNKAVHDDPRIAQRSGNVVTVLHPLLRVVEWYFAEFERGPNIDPLFQLAPDSPAASLRH